MDLGKNKTNMYKVNTIKRKVMTKKNEDIEYEHQEKVNCELARVKLSSPHMHNKMMHR
jgi:hypothetical protein